MRWARSRPVKAGSAYAEDRGLLPSGRNERYDANSLKSAARRDLDTDPEAFSTAATSLWLDLVQVWDAIDQGKELLAKALRKTGLPLQRLLTVEHLTAVATSFRLADVNSLYASLGESAVGPQSVVQRLIETAGGLEGAMDENLEDHPQRTNTLSRTRTYETGVVVDGDMSMVAKLARCCTPLPGDEIIGFLTRENGVSVHRESCTNAKALLRQPDRLVSVSWAPTTASGYEVSVQIEGLDQTGMLSDIVKVLADMKVNITSANVATTKDRLVKIRLTFEAADPKHVQHVLSSVRKVPGVYEISRVKQ